MDFLLIVGKYIFLALLYLFVFLVYRAMLRDVAGAAPSATEAARAARPEVVAPVQQPEAVVSAPMAPARPPAPIPMPPVAEPVRRPVGGARLIVVQSPGAGTLPVGTERLLSSATTLGRSRDNSIVLPDRFASAEHVLIYLSQGRHMLRDRDSTNGTFLNGQRVHSDVVLNSGDRLEIGTTILEYRQ